MQYFNLFFRFLVFLSLVLFVISCDNPASEDDKHEHLEPRGVVLKQGNQSILTVFDGTVYDTIELQNGSDNGPHTLYFLNHDSTEFQPHTDEGYSAGWSVSDTTIIQIRLGQNNRSDDQPWTIHLTAVSAGTTQFQLKLMHAGHEDFTTPDINAVVE